MNLCCAGVLNNHFHSLSDKILLKANLSEAELCPDINRVVLTKCTNQKIFDSLGYFDRDLSKVVLFNEEALYYKECGYLRVVYKTRDLCFAELLSLLCIEPSKYFVYSYMKNLGYNLKPFDACHLVVTTEDENFDNLGTSSDEIGPCVNNLAASENEVSELETALSKVSASTKFFLLIVSCNKKLTSAFGL